MRKYNGKLVDVIKRGVGVTDRYYEGLSGRNATVKVDDNNDVLLTIDGCTHIMGKLLSYDLYPDTIYVYTRTKLIMVGLNEY